MRRALHVVLSATLLVAAGCGRPGIGGDIVSEASPLAMSATDAGQLQSRTAAVCASSTEPCEDVHASELDGSCTTNLERDCTEAQADGVLRRWLIGPDGGPDGAGDTEVLAILDEHTIVVGYAFGSNLRFTGSQAKVHDDRVVVVLTFDEAPSTTEDGQPVFFTLELRAEREIVTIPTPIAHREIEVNIEVNRSQ